MNKTLFLAWQDKRNEGANRVATRGWFPIGRLDAESDRFSFRYTHGAERAEQEAGFRPLTSFPELHQRYTSDRLFEMFRNRVPSVSRPDYPAMLERLGLPLDETDPFEILAVSGGARQTDNLEAFPRIQRRKDGSFRCRFFVHGWRYMNEAAQARLQALHVEERLSVVLELNNPATGVAIQLQTSDDHHMLGWSPRYLVADLIAAIARAPAQIVATVVRSNPPPAPSNQRLLVQLEGKLPEGVEPMSSSDFLPLVN